MRTVEHSPQLTTGEKAGKSSVPSKHSKRLVQFLQDPIDRPNSILYENHREQLATEQNQLTPDRSVKSAMISDPTSPLRNAKIVEQLSRLNDSLNLSAPKLLNVKLDEAKRQKPQLKPSQSSPDLQLNGRYYSPAISRKAATRNELSTTQVTSREKSQQERTMSGLPFIHGQDRSMRGLLDAEISKSQIFTMPDDIPSILEESNGQQTPFHQWSTFKKEVSTLPPMTPKSTKQQKAKGGVGETKDFLVANQQHDKSLKLLQFLEKRTEKRSRSLQQRMVDAMDRSIKKGPLKFPTKLIRQISKEEKRKKQFKSQLKDLKDDKNVAKDSRLEVPESAASESASKSLPVDSDKILPDFRVRTDMKDPQLKDRLKVKTPGAPTTQEQVYSDFLPQILAESVNLKLRDDYNERKAEFEKRIQSNKVAAKKRAQLAVKSLLSTDLTIDAVCGRAEGQTYDYIDKTDETQADIHSKTLQLCQAYKGTKFIETGGRHLSEQQISTEKNKQAQFRVRRRLTRQRTVLMTNNFFSDEDEALYQALMEQNDSETPRQHETDNQKTQDALKGLLEEKFVSQIDSRIESKTLQLLYNEVIRQVRAWSVRHADLLVELVRRKDAIAAQKAKQVKQMAHLVKDKLARTVAKLQSRLKQVDSMLRQKVKTLDMALRAQDQVETNFDKAMNLNHGGAQKKMESEAKLDQLKQRVAAWLPNFTKYEDNDCFTEGLKLITPERLLSVEEKADLWEIMRCRLQFDSEKDMWGFTAGEKPENVNYQGQVLTMSYKLPELWLRSDLSRLMTVFDVATPQNVALDEALYEIKQLKYENNKQDKVIKNLNGELHHRFELLQSFKDKNMKQGEELARMAQIEETLKRYQVDKAHVACQAELMRETLLNHLMKKEVSPNKQGRKNKRQKSMKNLLQGGSVVNIDLGIPSLDDKSRSQSQIVRSKPKGKAKRSSAKAEETFAPVNDIDPQDAVKKLNKMIDLDLENVLVPLSQASLTRLRRGLVETKRLQFQPYFMLLKEFFESVLKQLPFFPTSAWHLYQQVLNDHNTDLMQGLQDLEQLGHQDWRFAVLGRMCGIQFNKVSNRGDDVETALIKNVLIDKKQNTITNFVKALLDSLQASQNVIKHFSQALTEREECDVDFDVVIKAIVGAAKTQFTGLKQMKKTVLPQLLALTHQRLSKAVGKVECYLQETATQERLLFSQVHDEMMDDEDVLEVKFFVDLVHAIHYHGLGDFEYQHEGDLIEYTTLVDLFKSHLRLTIPTDLETEENMQSFVIRRIIALRRPKKNDERPADQLVQSDLSILHSIYIRQYISLKEAVVHSVRAAQNCIKLQQCVFEPVFQHFRSTDGYLNLTGTFYQSLLFISKCNVASSFVDASAQQRAFDKINKRTRQLINTLRNQRQFKKIGLAKFTEVCMDLGLTNQMYGALRKVGYQELLIPSESLTEIKNAIGKLDPFKPFINMAFHGQIGEIYGRQGVESMMHELGNRIYAAKPPTKFCGVITCSHFSQQMVFNVLNQDQMRPSFDVYMDCGLAELAMTVEASKKAKTLKTGDKQSSLSPKKKNIKRLVKLDVLIQLARQRGFNLTAIKADKSRDSNAPTNDRIMSKNTSLIELSRVTEDAAADRSQDKKTQFVDGVAVQTEVSAIDDSMNQLASQLQTSFSPIKQEEDEPPYFYANQGRGEQSPDGDSGRSEGASASQLRFEDEIRIFATDKTSDRSTPRSKALLKNDESFAKLKIKLLPHLRVQEESQAEVIQHELESEEKRAIDDQEEMKDAVEQIPPSKTENGMEPQLTQNTWKMGLTNTLSEAFGASDGLKPLLHKMQEPVIAISGQKPQPASTLAPSLDLISLPESRNRGPASFVMKTAIIMGENKWRQDLERHKERLQDARSTSKKWVSRPRREPAVQHHVSRTVSKIPSKLNSDLDLDDHSEFSETFEQYQTPGPSADISVQVNEKEQESSYMSPEQNRRFAGQTFINQIVMSGAEPPDVIIAAPKGFKSPKRQKSPAKKAIPPSLDKGLSLQGTQTLKLLNSAAQAKLSGSPPRVKTQNFGFDQIQPMYGGATQVVYPAIEVLPDDFDLAALDPDALFKDEVEAPYKLDGETSQLLQGQQSPFMGIKKMNLEQRGSPKAAEAELQVIKEQTSVGDQSMLLQRMYSVHTLMAKYSSRESEYLLRGESPQKSENMPLFEIEDQKSDKE